MADRYWVGGTASWDGTAGSKWALTSGGAGGQAVPTSADDVFFDAASGAVTCTIAGGNTGAKSINCTGFTGTITGTADITVAGSITLFISQTYTHTGAVTITGTGTLTTAGKTFSGVTIDGVGITVTLGDALNTSSRNITVTRGTFTTSGSNYNVTTGVTFSSSNTNVRSITLGTSTVSVGNWDVGTTTNLTFSGASSTISVTATTPTFSGGGLTYGSVTFTSIDNSTRTINGQNTFSNLTITSVSGQNGIALIRFNSDQTITGTLTAQGNSPVRRIVFASSSFGTQRTLTVANWASNGSVVNLDFKDIALTGGMGTLSGTRIGDGGNNSGITFSAAKTVYWNLTGSQTWGSTAWATTSGGTPNINNFPLPQDTAIIDNAGAATSIQFGIYFIGNIDASLRTSAVTFTQNQFRPNYICGNVTLGSGVTVTTLTSQAWLYIGTANQTITSNGASLNFNNTIEKPNGTSVLLGDNFSSDVTNTLTLTSGVFNASNYNVSTGLFNSNNSNTRTLTMGSGTWTLSGTGVVWNLATITNLTFNKNTANIVLSNTTTTARTFAGGGLTYNNLTIGGATGTSTLTFQGTNTFDTLASTKTVAHTIIFPNVTTTVSNWTITGTSGNVVTLQRTGASGTFTLAKSGGGVISGVDYLSISNSTASPTNTWYAGANSTNGGGNTNWLFTASPTDISGSASINGTATVTGLGNYTTSSSGSMSASATVTTSGSLTFSVNGAIDGIATVSALGGLAQSGIAYINGTASVSALGGLLNSGQASITANGTVTANGGLLYSGQASVNGTATVTADGFYIADGVAAISAFADVTALGGVIIIGAAGITANGTIIANGVIQGDNWSPVSAGAETWTPVTAGTETWTDTTPSTDIWLRQG
jgi:hypothetical protein